MTTDENRALIDRLEGLEREAGWSGPGVEYIRMRGPTVAAFCNELMMAFPDLLRLARRGLLAEELLITEGFDDDV